jgi:hypothetical protein
MHNIYIYTYIYTERESGLSRSLIELPPSISYIYIYIQTYIHTYIYIYTYI